MSERTRWIIVSLAFQAAGLILLGQNSTSIWLFGAWLFVNGTVGINSMILGKQP